MNSTSSTSSGLIRRRYNGRNLLGITSVERIEPFLMSVISSTDLWLFITSNGGLTAGRVSVAGSVFPYETVDRLYQQPGRAGCLSLLRRSEGDTWEPLALSPSQEIDRTLFKSDLGDIVRFEELHRGWDVEWSATWRPSDRFGWIREVELVNRGNKDVAVDVLDGFLDVLPAQVELPSQQRASYLIDAYRHTEFHPERRSLALYTLSSLLTDRAEPAEALRTNVVWRMGLDGATYISPRAVKAWRHENLEAEPQTRGRGEKGAYLVSSRVELAPGKSQRWRMVIDAALDHGDLANLSGVLRSELCEAELDRDVEQGASGLTALAHSVDGYQRSAEQNVDENHLSNAMFNGLRGGFLLDEGAIPKREVEASLRIRNRSVLEQHQTWLEGLEDSVDVETLRSQARAQNNPQLARLIDEVLPLAFGRRHGDPSRPWNQFSIHTQDENKQPLLHYEGNWRDIFQNWEALARSYPDYLESFVAKFVNASTVDGFNPYRISREGIDWEVPDPEDPWSNIGYWGDHQVIYLLRLIEGLQDYRPDSLGEMLDARRYSFGRVPYRLSSFDEMLKDPRNTIEFDDDVHADTESKVEATGSDGRLVWRDGQVALVTLWEKLLICLGTRLSNLVLDGGIWMNTQRPEWNDANNALPGPGLSVVTLAHTLRLVRFLKGVAEDRSDPIVVSSEVASWLKGYQSIYAEVAEIDAWTPQARRSTLDRLGRTYETYRTRVYPDGPQSGEEALPPELVRTTLAVAEKVLERSLRSNQREDGLFHAYNTAQFGDTEIRVQHLNLMLEGQVAALDARVLGPREASALVDRMFESPLYREDQHSFLLYPDRVLSDFERRNEIPQDMGRHLVDEVLGGGDRRLAYRDGDDTLRFSADLRNEEALLERVNELRQATDGTGTSASTEELRALYEQTFTHSSFTGRSGSMYGFEGLGCIYWHMVAKFLLAVQETFYVAYDAGEETDELRARYDRVRAGFNFNKTPEEYGAFPTDAYSHTPGGKGAQQPGMTGQVKEQVLVRFGELGLRIRSGCLNFDPRLLPAHELSSDPITWTLGDQEILIPAGGLGFSYCGIPVIYRSVNTHAALRIYGRDGKTSSSDALKLDPELTRALLSRRSSIHRLEVDLEEGRFRD